MGYPVAGFDAAIPDRFHHAAFFVRDVADPVRLSRGHEHVRCPAFDVAVEFFILVDFEFGRVFDGAAFAVVVTIFAVNGRVDFGEEGAFGRFDEATIMLRCRGEECFAAFEGGGKCGGHFAAVVVEGGR